MIESIVLPEGCSTMEMVTAGGNKRIQVHDPRPSPPPPRPRSGALVDFYYPYTYLHPTTLAGAPPDAVWVDVAAVNVAYFAALSTWWAAGRSFAIVEQDVVCRPDVIEAFETCPEPWCVFGYDPICHPECMEAWANMLGCTRFSAELIAALPDAVMTIVDEFWDWHNLCDGLGRNLRAAGFTHHWHFPSVRHHSWENR